MRPVNPNELVYDVATLSNLPYNSDATSNTQLVLYTTHGFEINSGMIASDYLIGAIYLHRHDYYFQSAGQNKSSAHIPVRQVDQQDKLHIEQQEYCGGLGTY